MGKRGRVNSRLWKYFKRPYNWSIALALTSGERAASSVARVALISLWTTRDSAPC